MVKISKTIETIPIKKQIIAKERVIRYINFRIEPYSKGGFSISARITNEQIIEKIIDIAKVITIIATYELEKAKFLICCKKAVKTAKVPIDKVDICFSSSIEIFLFS